MAGTIPTVVYYGIGLLSDEWFYAATAIVCGLVGLAIGSSWTTAATLGVAFVALAPLLGADPAIAAGAVISGAYFGDKMTPISETTVLVPVMVGGVTTQEHIGAMLWTSGPAIVLALLGLRASSACSTPPSSDRPSTRRDAQAILAGEFNISLINLLPLVLLVVLSLRQAPPFLAIFGSAVFAAVLAIFTQPAAVAAFVGDPSRGGLPTALDRDLRGAGDRIRVEHAATRRSTRCSRAAGWRRCSTRSGSCSARCPSPRSWRTPGSSSGSFGPVLAAAHTTGRLIAAVVGTAIGLNIIAGDQYVAIVMPSRVYRAEFKKRGIAPRMLSRTVEDAGTVTSPLVPWNSCGAYMAGVLGVATVAYLPFAFFNLLSPLISLIYGFTGFHIEHVTPPDQAAPRHR